MGFPSALSAGQKTTLRTPGYWQRTFCAFNPGDIVFQCEANEDIFETPFKAFAWTNTLQGAYTDVWQGMVVYISSTADFAKDYKYRGRVRLAPSASEFRIDLNATTLETGDIVTVVRDADFFAVNREGDLVDGSIAYHAPPPMTTGLPSVLVLYDSDADGSVAWTPAQTGIAAASGTSISSYAWAISGTGSSSVSNAAAQNPNFTFAAGFHYLVRLTTTDSGGVSNFIFVQVYAITRVFDAPVIVAAIAGSVSQDLDNGYTGSITAYTGVSELPYRTHAVVFAVEHFGDNSSTPINTNVLMHGRLRSESIITEASADAGRLMRVTYPIEGITSYMQRMKVPNDIVRATATPNEWGELTGPTPYRMAVYFLSIYTTLLNLVSFSAGDSLFDDWKAGGEPVSIDGGYALDTLNTLLERIKASASYAPDGEIRCEILASYAQDRSGLTTIMDFTVSDARSWTLDIDTSKNTAQVVGYGGMWNTTSNTFILFTAQSPSIPYGDSPEIRELNRELLRTDSATSDAAAELAARTGNDYAYNNNKWLLTTLLRGAHRWLVATGYLRYTWTIAASYSTRGIAITTDTKWQCQSVNLTINPDGTYDTGADFMQETEFTDAQNIASLLPNNLSGMNPVLPILSDYPAFPDSPTWSYPTDTPTDAELQPIGNYSGWQGYSPFSPDQAAQAAQKQGNTKCRVVQVNMRNSGTTLSTFTTVNGAGYTLKISGFGQISTGTWLYHVNFTNLTGGYVPDANFGGTSAWIGGTGWTKGVVGGVAAVDIHYFLSSSTTDVTAIRFLYNNDTASANVNVTLRLLGVDVYSDVQSAVIGDGELYVATPPFVEFDEVVLQLVMPSTTGNPVITGVTFEGENTNPFTGDAASTLNGDAFYTFPPEGEDGSAAVFDPTAGLLLDGSKPAVIPNYAGNHSYTVPYTGTGNPLQLNYALSDYTNVPNRLITVEVCRNP